ncbi:hypothetical protein E2562_031938 [Oryza meyeriana var. granulata]|uniref:Uncharacterized protein n=1 Tax=Oryza meyeriana var. granulata TaxID=110450 RepID=A0A6G1F0E8_9ORYZ|nr:hypothetical protein E2562_031938 [Oryza meyeriana var. granulata]
MPSRSPAAIAAKPVAQSHFSNHHYRMPSLHQRRCDLGEARNCNYLVASGPTSRRHLAASGPSHETAPCRCILSTTLHSPLLDPATPISPACRIASSATTSDRYRTESQPPRECHASS